MARLCLALVAWLVLSPMAWAGEKLEKEIQQAREQLDQAAQHLAHLHKLAVHLQRHDRRGDDPDLRRRGLARG